MVEVGLVLLGVVLFLAFMSYADRQPHERFDDDEDDDI